MATPPKRVCPSPAPGGEGARVKKVSVEGNIGKERARRGCGELLRCRTAPVVGESCRSLGYATVCPS